jgi:hypothetical protein
MSRLFSLVQFLPLTIFIGVARHRGFTAEAWSFAFQCGALVALVELVVLHYWIRQPLNRLLWGANLFLIFGGIAFRFDLNILMEALSFLKASAIFVSVGLVCIIALFTSKSGVFERQLSTSHNQKLYSIFFIGCVAVAFVWSSAFKDNNMLGGTFPFIALIVIKMGLQRRLS